MRPINRITPHLPAAAYKTYAVSAPLATHFRPGTCEEVDCQPHQFGWATTVPRGSQDEAVIRSAGRSFSEERIGDGFIKFTFPPGQPCFRASTHQVPLERPWIYLVRDGDWRGNPRGTQAYVHKRGGDWVDDFANHQQKLADRLNQG